MKNTSKISTLLEADAPFAQRANYRFDQNDRQYIDNQIIGMEDHLVKALIRGRHATYIRVHSASETLRAGDCVCLCSVDTTEPQVTKAVSAALVNAHVAFGVAISDAAPGSYALICIGGALPRTITGLDVADGGFVRVNTTTARCQQVDALDPADYGIGAVDEAGSLAVVPGMLAGGVGGGGGGEFTASNDLDGDNTAQTVVGIWDIPIEPGSDPSEDEVPAYNADLNRWEFRSRTGSAITLVGDVSGSPGANTVDKIKGVLVNTPSGAGLVLTSTSTTTATWQTPATGGGGIPWLGTDGQLNVSNGAGVPKIATGIFAGSTWMSFGTTPATSGYLRFPNSGGALISVKTGTGVDQDIFFFAPAGNGSVTCGGYGVFDLSLNGISVTKHGSFQTVEVVNGVVKQVIRAEAAYSSVPRLGWGTAWGASEGTAFVGSAGTGPGGYTLGEGEYSRFRVYLAHSDGGTFNFPAPPNDASAYIKWITNAGSVAKTLSTGAGAIPIVAPPASHRLYMFDPAGISVLDTGSGAPSQGVANNINGADGSGGWTATDMYVSGASISFTPSAATTGFVRFPYSSGVSTLVGIRNSAGLTHGIMHFEGNSGDSYFHLGAYGEFKTVLSGTHVYMNGSVASYINVAGVNRVAVTTTNMDVSVPLRLGATGSSFAATGTIRFPAGAGTIVSVRNSTNALDYGILGLDSGDRAYLFSGPSISNPVLYGYIYPFSNLRLGVGANTCLHLDNSSGTPTIKESVPLIGEAGKPFGRHGEHTFTVPGSGSYTQTASDNALHKWLWHFPSGSTGAYDLTLNVYQPANFNEAYEKFVVLPPGATVRFQHPGATGVSSLQLSSSSSPNGWSGIIAVGVSGIYWGGNVP